MRRLIILLCLVFILPRNIYAETRVTVYISVGIVVGSASLFISLAFSDSFSRNKKQSPDGEEIFLSSADYLRTYWPQEKDDDIPEIGNLKLISW
ncbi:MAG: hypothetical protein A2X87_03710 [Deltaproteobacteria bacterium GWC2_42_51]|nr:MAG: hypothetical protein A2056_04115 [Deltaproteobacteria bacterium GWA2_42_85]OGP37464.1 MAG: hypothetical protein A2X87_03710 [Deltaproteobacteria bacterium GWC2_42_51]OGP39357.1 MAG: hypothetical protein A2090_10470 [Deltaproteobacteria bacterium GWD2_42_10]OGP47571.1 MAG: hypothetical protein A2022_09245 [Deltaproteobacteria bacterium GWF2_42_12]OGQ24907.1 MAG: hypothetical protein A3D29_00650 [Deltaproteobacteria bacterium RIFCSPHIGHO2_02_FULL_42_44]OGQ37858.1 MAG: hypothetical protei